MDYEKHAHLDSFDYEDDDVVGVWAPIGKHARPFSYADAFENVYEMAGESKNSVFANVGFELNVDPEATGRLPISRKRFIDSTPSLQIKLEPTMYDSLDSDYVLRVGTRGEANWNPRAVDVVFGDGSKEEIFKEELRKKGSFKKKIQSQDPKSASQNAPKENQESEDRWTDDSPVADGGLTIDRSSRFNWKAIAIAFILTTVFLLLALVAIVLVVMA